MSPMIYIFFWEKRPFQNIVGKGENAGNQHFPLFPQFFSTLSRTEIIIFVTFILSFANALNLDKVTFFVVWEWAKHILLSNNLQYVTKHNRNQ